MNAIFCPASVQEEIIEIALHIERHRPSAATLFLDAVEDACKLMADMPQIGANYGFDLPRLRDVRVWSIRGFESYLIFYRPIATGVQVLHVAHGARDIEKLFGV